jgi:mRNA-degrading endonuclease RelE of RelBE toxin-antitoxin system
MTSEFRIITTSRFERELKKLVAQHPGLPLLFRRVIHILKTDPLNRSRQHPIKKLEAVPAGEGQYRIRSGRFRFRYDIDGQAVYLKACSLRREDTYR